MLLCVLGENLCFLWGIFYHFDISLPDGQHILHFLLVLCVSVFIYTHVLCISACAYVCMCMQRWEANHSCCSSVSLCLLFWDRVFLSDLGITSLAIMIGHWALRMLTSLSSQLLDYKHITMYRFLKWNLGLKLRSLCFLAWIIYRLSHFLSLPWFSWI